jgi:hypothetical protein
MGIILLCLAFKDAQMKLKKFSAYCGQGISPSFMKNDVNFHLDLFCKTSKEYTYIEVHVFGLTFSLR